MERNTSSKLVVGEPRPGDLPLQDQDSVAQGQDLGVAAITGHDEQSDTGDEQTDKVGEWVAHRRHGTEQVQAQYQDIRLLGTLRL